MYLFYYFACKKEMQKIFLNIKKHFKRIFVSAYINSWLFIM